MRFGMQRFSLVVFMSVLAVQAVIADANGDRFFVKNGDFEDGTAEWTGKASMSVDDTVAHRGRKSVCLDVVNPKTDGIYITQKFPVNGGRFYKASCFIKTEDVRNPHARGVPAEGAGIFVEWADKDGKWLDGGQYSLGVWGTNDWRRVECARLNAPEKAAQATFYLAMRAAGKAWFDDVEFSERQVPTKKIQPLDGCMISNNCPAFSWHQLERMRRYQLEISCDAAFPDEKTLKFDVGGGLGFQLEKPLRPGVWYWRVNSTGRKDPSVWSFVQTASEDADCIPPLVQTQACRVTGSNESFVVSVKDMSTRLPCVFWMGVKGVYAGFECGTLKYRFDPPAGGWRQGLTDGEILAVDAAGNRSSTRLWLLNASKPGNAVTIGSDNCFRQDGKAIFPLGIYEVSPKYLKEVRGAGWDVVHQYKWEELQDDIACRGYLDDCWAADGLRAFIGFDRGLVSRNGIKQGNFEHVAKRVGALADHPGLFCWYLFDEPQMAHQFITPHLLTEFADLIRALDPYHPVVVSTDGSRMIDYRRSWDTHWTQAYGNPVSMVKKLEGHQCCLMNSSPITLLVNCNDDMLGAALREGEKIGNRKFYRDYDHLRAAAFLGVVKGCNGVWWWWFARDRKTKFYSASKSPDACADLVKVVRELAALRDFVTAEGTVVAGTASSGKDNVEWWRKDVDGRKLFIAVNTADHPVSVEISVPGDSVRRLKLRRYEVMTEGFD